MDKMTNIEAICKLLGITKKTWYNWKNEQRPIVALITTYLTNTDILEFLDKKTISKFDFFSTIEPDLIHTYSDLKFDFVVNPYNEKFFRDFLCRYKSELILLDRLTIKNDFLSLLFDYHAQLVKIAEIIKYPIDLISKEFHDFYSIFNTKESVFFLLLLNLIKNDFIYYNSFFYDDLEQTSKNYEEFKTPFLPYENKYLLNIPINQIQHLNTFDNSKYDTECHDYIPRESKDFFEVYENYLLANS